MHLSVLKRNEKEAASSMWPAGPQFVEFMEFIRFVESLKGGVRSPWSVVHNRKPETPYRPQVKGNGVRSSILAFSGWGRDLGGACGEVPVACGKGNGRVTNLRCPQGAGLSILLLRKIPTEKGSFYRGDATKPILPGSKL